MPVGPRAILVLCLLAPCALGAKISYIKCAGDSLCTLLGSGCAVGTRCYSGYFSGANVCIKSPNLPCNALSYRCPAGARKRETSASALGDSLFE